VAGREEHFTLPCADASFIVDYVAFAIDHETSTVHRNLNAITVTAPTEM
jgi:hypothetical protein